MISSTVFRGRPDRICSVRQLEQRSCDDAPVASQLAREESADGDRTVIAREEAADVGPGGCDPAG